MTLRRGNVSVKMINIPVYIEFFTKMSSAIFTLLLGKLLFDEANSLWAFASAYGGEFVIVTLIQMYAGSIADKYSPLRILIFTNAISSIVFISLFTVYDYFLSHSLFIAAAIVYIFRPFYRTSLFVLIRTVAKKEELKVLNGRVTSASQLGQIFGLTLTGAMLSFYSVNYIFLAMAIIYISCLFMSIKFCTSSHYNCSTNARGDGNRINWREFGQFLKLEKHFSIRLLSSFSIAFCLGGFYVHLAPVVVEKFANSEIWLSILSVSYAAGAIISGMLIKKTNNSLSNTSSDNLLLFNQILAIATFMSFGLFDNLYWVPILLFTFGISTTLSAVGLSTYLQNNTLDEVAGRTAAAQNIVIASGNALVAFYSSYLFDYSFIYSSIGVSIILFFQAIFFRVLFLLYPGKPSDVFCMDTIKS